MSTAYAGRQAGQLLIKGPRSYAHSGRQMPRGCSRAKSASCSRIAVSKLGLKPPQVSGAAGGR